MCFLFAKYRKLHTNQRLVSRNGDSSHNTNDMDYEMLSKSTKAQGDNNTNGIVRNSITLAEDDNSLKFDNDITETGYLNPYQPLVTSFRLNSNERSSYGAYSNLYEWLKRNWKSLSFGYEIPPNKYVGEVCTSAKVYSTDRGIPMIFSVTTKQCSTGTANEKTVKM